MLLRRYRDVCALPEKPASVVLGGHSPNSRKVLSNVLTPVVSKSRV
jgi:hypothetical protein